MKLVLSCEHGGTLIPNAYTRLFKNHQALLNSHRGYDPGTLDLFDYLRPMADFSLSNPISRLLIEYNRSLHHPGLFSEFSSTLHASDKKILIESYYLPYRTKIENAIENLIEQGEQVLHISLHSFTPELKGSRRTNDIGLLYDPGRKEEKDFSRLFKLRLLARDPGLQFRANYPYLGKADGFTTYLRRCFPHNYLGIELEINQGLIENNQFPESLRHHIKAALTNI